ncbi:SEC-C metal-binding domain-containing protein [Pseudalkalibacillus decolorationis]|uniref:SEC-C metal-binding domain-containing protein n=1 Tax=Pseudalkalibacillus decolorationis TaxID=163879 RepID=UPI00214906D0|nr:SEC-C metal-binding domain-containing protein [Pseudalkalibacillus decolorationis]
MVKINRNDPCPCGSGKKYKKCCLPKKNNVVDFLQEKRARTYLTLFDRIMEFSFTDYDNQIVDSIERRIDLSIIEKEFRGNLMDVLILWAVFNLPISFNKTPTERFSEIKPLSTEEDEIIRQWKSTKPSIYVVVKHIKGQRYYVSDYWTEEQQIIKFPELKDSLVGLHFLGLLLPIGEKSPLIVPPIFFPNEDMYTVFKLVEDLKRDQQLDTIPETINSNFPEVALYVHSLTVGLSISEELESFEEFEELSYTEESVIHLFNENTESVYPDDLRYTINKIWARFCKFTQPQIRKPEAFTATLEYLVDQYYGTGSLTQSKLGRKYNVSPSTISNRYKEIIEVLSIIGIQSDNGENKNSLK